MINEISSKTPYLCKVSPATPNVHMEDVLNAGGISAILKELSKKDGVLNLDRPTITGKTLGETIEQQKILMKILFALLKIHFLMKAD